jgi:UDP-hydrolysing UDP-N-acetyl-D-glucosamine 2-epimerase
MNNRVIGVFTGNRADYGLQLPILKAIEAEPTLDYQLIVSGAHLDSTFGRTIEEIQRDGFLIHSQIEIELDSSSNLGTAHAIGKGILAISEQLNKDRPDILLVYGDRFECFAAVIAASQLNIPTAHVEGGDLTDGGALDDSIRHAITKLSHLHFSTNAQASNRILAMGEEDWRVHTVGLPSNDLISEGNFASRKQVCENLNLDVARPIVLFTQHSVTTEISKAGEQVQQSINAIKRLADEGIQVIVTYPNNDAGGKAIIDRISVLKSSKVDGIEVRESLGRYLYHGVLALSREEGIRIVCLGNSSSGLKETPFFGCPTINVGSRQNGRLRGRNVLDVDYSSDLIYEAVKKGLFDEEFRMISRTTPNPYWLGFAGPKIANILASVPIDIALLQKKMTLLGEKKDGWYR